MKKNALALALLVLLTALSGCYLDPETGDVVGAGQTPANSGMYQP